MTVGAQVQPAVTNITPVYEGWLPNPDGSFELLFGYMNREWSGETHIPLGPNNNMEPGGPDLGQPTNFFPRRNRFAFQVHVPKDFGTKEIVWTLTSKGQDGQGVRHAQARLRARRHVDHVEHRHRRRAEHDAGHGRQQGAGADVRRSARAVPPRSAQPVAFAAERDRRWEAEPEEHAGTARRRLHRCRPRRTACGCRSSSIAVRGRR